MSQFDTDVHAVGIHKYKEKDTKEQMSSDRVRVTTPPPVRRASATYLTELPTRASSSASMSLCLDLASRPSSTNRWQQSVAPAVATRVGSAAPTKETILPALCSSLANANRPTISQMSQRRNRENQLRLEVLAEADTEAHSMRRVPSEASLMSFGDSAAYENLFAALNRGADANSSHNAKKRRKSLVERTSLLGSDARSTIHEETESKLTTLRSNFSARLMFFMSVKELKRTMLEERMQRGCAMMHRNVVMARASTPQFAEHHLAEICERRDAKIHDAQERKAAVVADKQRRCEQLVHRTNRTGTQVGDPKELERERQLLALSASWRNIVALGSRAQQMFAQLLENRREQLRRAAEDEVRKESFLQHWDKIMLIQRYWKRKQRLRLLQRKATAADVIVALLRATPRIQAQFRKGVRQMIHRVCCIQRHFRAVKVVRLLRRDEGVKKIDTYIRNVTLQIDSSVSMLHKQRKHAEAQQAMAIKARKPIFEAQVAALQANIVQLTKKRFVLSALTEESKRETVGALLQQRENEYREKLRLFGKDVLEKYMIEFNIDKVMKERQQKFDEDLECTSISQLSLVSVWALKRQAAGKKLRRPVMCVNISDADVRELFADGGELSQRAMEDFQHSTEAQYSTRR